MPALILSSSDLPEDSASFATLANNCLISKDLFEREGRVPSLDAVQGMIHLPFFC